MCSENFAEELQLSRNDASPLAHTHTTACTLHIDKAIHIERTERNDTHKKTET